MESNGSCEPLSASCLWFCACVRAYIWFLVKRNKWKEIKDEDERERERGTGGGVYLWEGKRRGNGEYSHKKREVEQNQSDSGTLHVGRILAIR